MKPKPFMEWVHDTQSDIKKALVKLDSIKKACDQADRVRAVVNTAEKDALEVINHLEEMKEHAPLLCGECGKEAIESNKDGEP